MLGRVFRGAAPFRAADGDQSMHRHVLAASLGAAALLATAGVTTPAARAAAGPQAERPDLWSIETQNGRGKPLKTMMICADAVIRQSFLQPMPSLGGQPCQLLGPAVETGGRFAARCTSQGRLLDVQAQSAGDLTRDFSVTFLIRAVAPVQADFAQTLRYRRLGACPTGWLTGDAAAPGDRRTVNAINGETRRLGAPVVAPAL